PSHGFYGALTVVSVARTCVLHGALDIVTAFGRREGCHGGLKLLERVARAGPLMCYERHMRYVEAWCVNRQVNGALHGEERCMEQAAIERARLMVDQVKGEMLLRMVDGCD
ncbi:hypothetical protein Dimus_003091, partial [Dionaea muscipula]